MILISLTMSTLESTSSLSPRVKTTTSFFHNILHIHYFIFFPVLCCLFLLLLIAFEFDESKFMRKIFYDILLPLSWDAFWGFSHLNFHNFGDEIFEFGKLKMSLSWTEILCQKMRHCDSKFGVIILNRNYSPKTNLTLTLSLFFLKIWC